MKNIVALSFLCFLLVSCEKYLPGLGKGSSKKGDIVYFESNDSRDNQNRILAYKNTGNGILKEIPGSPFYTGGSGLGDPEQLLGPLDSDNQLKISEDGKFLIAVNPGSNTIAVFSIMPDGSLKPVTGSPFPSGGETPVSVGTNGHFVYIVNKSQDFAHPVSGQPNYTVFEINGDGKLKPVSNSTFLTTKNSSPAQALVSRNGKFLFGADFLGFMLSPSAGTLRSFTIAQNGKLTAVPGTPLVIPKMGGALGLTQNPKDNTLYVGFPVTSEVGVYNIDMNTGGLTFMTSVMSGPAACWLRTAHSGNNLYALNSGENSISIFNTVSPKSPVLIDKVKLKLAGPLYTANGMQFTTSQAFSFEFSPDEKYVYIVSQHTNTDFSIGNYNVLHVLEVHNDGTLEENSEPIIIPVSNMYRPQGVVVVSAKS